MTQGLERGPYSEDKSPETTAQRCSCDRRRLTTQAERLAWRQCKLETKRMFSLYRPSLLAGSGPRWHSVLARFRGPQVASTGGTDEVWRGRRNPPPPLQKTPAPPHPPIPPPSPPPPSP